MSRIAPAIPVSPKMLRHFASVTVAITFCVAIFADGEGREAIAAQIQARESRNNLLQVEAGKLGAREIGINRLKDRAKQRMRPSFSADSSDDGGGYGAPMDSAAGAGTGSDTGYVGGGPDSRRNGPQGPNQGPNVGGHPIGAGPGAGQPGQANGRAAPPRPTQQQLESIMAASRARSGRSN